MGLFDFLKKKPPEKEYEWHCPKHGYQAYILHFQYSIGKRLCFACVGEKLVDAGVCELVKKEKI